MVCICFQGWANEGMAFRLPQNQRAAQLVSVTVAVGVHSFGAGFMFPLIIVNSVGFPFCDQYASILLPLDHSMLPFSMCLFCPWPLEV